MAFELDPISSGYSQAKINQNFQALEDELNNRVLRRSSEVDEPNQMAEDLDLNDNNIINVDNIDVDTITLGGQEFDFTSIEGVLPPQTGQAGKFLKTNGSVSSWEIPAASEVSNTPAGNVVATTVQGAIDELDSDLTTGLAGKANTVHTHTESDITDLDKYTQAEVNSGFVDQDSDTGAANLPTGTTAQRPGSPSEGMFRRNSETSEWEGYNGSSWESVGGAGASAPTGNKVINGDFNINQYNRSGTVVLAAGEFGPSRFKAGAGGCTYTFASSNGYTTLTITAGTLLQIIPGAFIYTGDHTLSFGGTAQGQINGGGFGSTGITAALTGGSDVTIEFNTGTLFQVQLEEGANASSFLWREPLLERKLCEQFYRKTYDDNVNPGTATDTGLVAAGYRAGVTGAAIAFDTPMFGTPTTQYYSRAGTANQGSYYTAGSWFEGDTVSQLAAYPKGLLLSINGSGGGTTIIHYVADAEI